VTICTLCRQGLSHCHGTLIVYAYDVIECSDPECRDADLARHELVIHAEEITVQYIEEAA
jgi:hypothetical protein